MSRLRPSPINIDDSNLRYNTTKHINTPPHSNPTTNFNSLREGVVEFVEHIDGRLFAQQRLHFDTHHTFVAPFGVGRCAPSWHTFHSRWFRITLTRGRRTFAWWSWKWCKIKIYKIYLTIIKLTFVLPMVFKSINAALNNSSSESLSSNNTSCGYKWNVSFLIQSIKTHFNTLHLVWRIVLRQRHQPTVVLILCRLS